MTQKPAKNDWHARYAEAENKRDTLVNVLKQKISRLEARGGTLTLSRIKELKAMQEKAKAVYGFLIERYIFYAQNDVI